MTLNIRSFTTTRCELILFIMLHTELIFCKIALQQGFFGNMTASDNYLLNKIIDDPGPTWMGELLIVKSDPSGHPIDVTDEDFNVLPTLLGR